MKIEFNAITLTELRLLADFVRNLADSQDRYPTSVGPVDVVDAGMENVRTELIRLIDEDVAAAKPEPKAATESEPKPVEKKRRGRPPRRAATADENAEYAAAAERATNHTAKRVAAEPEPVEDSPQVQAADAADEAAESAAVKAEDPKLTHDDIRQELGAYMRRYGMPAAQEDGPRLFKIIFPDVTPAKISDIPDTQEDLGKVLAGIREMSAKNPYTRTVIST